jgi:hypothetical protein
MAFFTQDAAAGEVRFGENVELGEIVGLHA